jgi:UDP-N-acetylglucosamine/UDP-N-acetylgalactosamine diphosphorylase
MSGDRTYVIEYSDLSDELATARNEDGTLLFSAGSIAIHILSRKFVEDLTEGGVCRLSLHRADKKVPFIDESGQLVTPDEPNAVKLEMFIFDALPMSENSVILQTTRQEEFSPIKNRDGQDSPESCTADQIARCARWLTEAGIEVPKDDAGNPDAVIEISPLYADSSEILAERVERGLAINSGDEIYLE